MKRRSKKKQKGQKRKESRAKKREKKRGSSSGPAPRQSVQPKHTMASGMLNSDVAYVRDIAKTLPGGALGEFPPGLASMLAAASAEHGLAIGDANLASVARTLSKCDARFTISVVAGLLTVPAYQAETLRLELLLHLAVLHCAGRRQPTVADFRRWLQHDLVAQPVRFLEDPIEDVFVSSVVARGGNYRLLEGVWETADRYVQDVMDCLAFTEWGTAHRPVLHHATALLRLGNFVLDRAGVERWTVSEEAYPKDVFLAPKLDFRALGARVSIDSADLQHLGVSLIDLAPFYMTPDMRGRLRGEAVGHTTLERHPLVRFGNQIVVACPTAIGAAIRRYVLETMAEAAETGALARALRREQSSSVYGIALEHIDAPAAYATGLHKEDPPPAREPMQWDEVHCAIDTDKVAQVILLPDTLDGAAKSGLSCPMPLPETTAADLASHIKNTVAHLSKHARGGLAVIVHGGIGRGVVLALPRLPAHWHVVVLSVANFTTFAWSPEASLLRLWKLYEQMDWLAERGVQVVQSNGVLNQYAYWRSQDFDLVPRGFPLHSGRAGMLQIGTEFVLDLRAEERQLHDVHSVPVDAVGHAARVRRFVRTAFFPAMMARPIYIAEDFLRAGQLAGVYEHPQLTVWVGASRNDDVPEASEFVYQLWESVLSWLDRLVPEITRSVSVSGAPPVHLQIELTDPDRWRRIHHPDGSSVERPTASLDAVKQTASINIPFGFLSLLRRPENDGERALLEVAGTAILALLFESGHIVPGCVDGSGLDRLAASCVEQAMRGPDTRFIHLFEATRPMDHLAALAPERAVQPRLIAPEDMAAWQLGLAWTAIDRATLALRTDPSRARRVETRAQAADPAETFENSQRAPSASTSPPDDEEVGEITGADACTTTLAELVDVIWDRLRTVLVDINGPSLVHLALENEEAIFQEREQWRRTARAVIALYSDADDVERIAGEREGRRANASTASRVLVEMAVCTSPTTGGRAASLADLEHLMAGISTLIELASDSDAIRAGFAPARVALFPNGAVACDRTFIVTIANPFALESHASEFRVAAKRYAELYRRSETGAKAAGEDPEQMAAEGGTPSLFDESFSRAFASEYGLTPDRLLDAFGELIDIGMHARTLVVSTTRGEVSRRLASGRGYSAEEIRAFFSMLALTPRPAWNSTPRGFEKRDWYPWRFRRRLSLAARPLVVFGDGAEAPLLFGMYQLGASLSYLFENIQSAWLPEEFFKTKEMRQYRGAVAETEGAVFTGEVAKLLDTLGWEVRTEVLMSTLGAPAALGDLDVVAWKDGDKRLLLIECKRLQPARTVGEIAELLRNFRGDVGDRLGKHLARCEWVRANLPAVSRALGLPSSAVLVEPFLVTNRDVPMRYLTDLPLPPERIVQREMLSALL